MDPDYLIQFEISLKKKKVLVIFRLKNNNSNFKADP